MKIILDDYFVARLTDRGYVDITARAKKIDSGDNSIPKGFKIELESANRTLMIAEKGRIWGKL